MRLGARGVGTRQSFLLFAVRQRTYLRWQGLFFVDPGCLRGVSPCVAAQESGTLCTCRCGALYSRSRGHPRVRAAVRNESPRSEMENTCYCGSPGWGCMRSSFHLQGSSVPFVPRFHSVTHSSRQPECPLNRLGLRGKDTRL